MLFFINKLFSYHLLENNRKGDVIYFVLIHSVMCIQRGKSIHITCDGVKFVTSKI